MSRPIIGVVANFFDRKVGQYSAHSRLNIGYSDSIMRAGGLPVILPVIDDLAAMDQFLDRVDGVVFGGGYDISPARYGQPPHPNTHVLPDRLESFIFAMFDRVDRRADLPAIGICLGCQVFNVARGGTLHQHVPDAGLPGPLDHSANEQHYTGARAWHTVAVKSGSLLDSIVTSAGTPAGDATSLLEVNSGHHQAVATLGRGLVASAFSDDGIVEAIEDPSHKMLLAVQWHPEELSDRPEHLALFAALVNAAARR